MTKHRGLQGAVGSRWGRTAVVASVLLVLVGAVLMVVRVTGGPGTYRLSATFAEAPGIYPGNVVKVLGVKVGRVTAVEPGVEGVRVEVEVSEDHPVPADVSAFLMAPNAVNDRFLELAPAYGGTGPRLGDGDAIPLERTVVPQSVDQIIDNLDEFSQLLGPQGANEDGALSRMLGALSETFGGQGGTINELVGNLGTTLDAVAQDDEALTSGLTDLGELTTAAKQASTSYRSLAENLAAVSGGLAGDAPQVTAVLRNLQDLLAELNLFVRENKDELAGSITSLSKVAGEVGEQQRSLRRLMRGLPLATANLGETVVRTPEGLAVRARLNPVRGAGVGRQVCGDRLLRLMAVALTQKESERDVVDLACATDRWLDGFAKPKGAPDASAWTFRALQGLGK